MSDLLFRCASCGGVNRVDAERLHKAPTCGRCKASLDASGDPVHLDDDGLEALVANSPVPVLVDFYADWCAPCRAVAPAIATIAKESRGRLVVAKVDTDRHARVASRLGVRGIPAFFVFAGGKVVGQRAGAMPLGAMRQWVQPFLGTS